MAVLPTRCASPDERLPQRCPAPSQRLPVPCGMAWQIGTFWEESEGQSQAHSAAALGPGNEWTVIDNGLPLNMARYPAGQNAIMPKIGIMGSTGLHLIGMEGLYEAEAPSYIVAYRWDDGAQQWVKEHTWDHGGPHGYDWCYPHFIIHCGMWDGAPVFSFCHWIGEEPPLTRRVQLWRRVPDGGWAQVASVDGDSWLRYRHSIVEYNGHNLIGKGPTGNLAKWTAGGGFVDIWDSQARVLAVWKAKGTLLAGTTGVDRYIHEWDGNTWSVLHDSGPDHSLYWSHFANWHDDLVLNATISWAGCNMCRFVLPDQLIVFSDGPYGWRFHPSMGFPVVSQSTGNNLVFGGVGGMYSSAEYPEPPNVVIKGWARWTGVPGSTNPDGSFVKHGDTNWIYWSSSEMIGGLRVHCGGD